MIKIPSLSELKNQIRRDALAYDKLAKSYNALIKKERKARNLMPSKNGRVNVRDTASGRTAGKRIVEAWNKVARKGQKLKAELEIYSLKVRNQKRPQPKRTGKKPGKNVKSKRK